MEGVYGDVVGWGDTECVCDSCSKKEDEGEVIFSSVDAGTRKCGCSESRALDTSAVRCISDTFEDE